MNNFFGLTKYRTNIQTEVFAGLSTFLALSYIFVVNPAILSAGGMNRSAVFFATIVGSVLATLAMGLWANKPFAVAPGLEMNAYIAYVVVGGLAFSWQGAMGAVFWSGLLTVVLSFSKIRVKIIDSIPDSLKLGLAASVGVFLVLIALKVSGIFSYTGIQLTGLGDIWSKTAWVFYFGFVSVSVFKFFRIPGSVLFSIVGTSLFSYIIGLKDVVNPIVFDTSMFSALFALDFGVILDPKVWPVVLILFILDFYGSIAKFIGLTRTTNIVDEHGNVPKLQEALIVDGAGTVLGATLGTSNLITYVESAVGIGEGGRTGLTAIVCAVLMGLFLLLVPVVNLVPVVATTGAVAYVGLGLLPSRKDLSKYSKSECLAIFLMVAVTFITFGLDKAMFAGFVAFVMFKLLKGGFREVNFYLLISTAVLLLSMLLAF